MGRRSPGDGPARSSQERGKRLGPVRLLAGRYQSILLPRIKGFRGDFLGKVVAFGFLDNRSQRLAILVGQIASPRQVCQKWSERPVAERLDQRPEPPADELVTIQHRDKPVHEQRAIAADELLGLHPVQQLLHGGILSRPAARIEDVRQVPDRRHPPIPEDPQYRKLRFGDIPGGPTHAHPRIQLLCLNIQSFCLN